MADFKLAYQKTAKNEGGYSNDPTDSGGETWRGIARSKNPKWAGWPIVDSYRNQIEFERFLEQDVLLQKRVLAFYQALYWDAIKGDKINSQDVANSLYDSAVNFGPTVAIKLAQRSLNINETGVVNSAMLDKLNNV